MKRAVIFGVLGPTLGFLAGLALAVALGVRPFDAAVLSVMFAYAFAAGILPAALTGVVDGYLARSMNLPRRMFATAAAGYSLSVVLGLTLLSRRLSIEAVLLFGVFGMLAAAVCSALSGAIGKEMAPQGR